MATPDKQVPVLNPATTAVLQWLSYALWGWTTVAIGYLVWVVTYYNSNHSFSDISPESIPYGVVAIIILLTTSLLLDIFYSKREVEHKTGISSVIVVLHSVIFGLLGVGALVVVAFNIVNIAIAVSDPAEAATVILTALTFFVLYGLILVRIVRPFGIAKLRLIFRLAVSAIAAIVIITAIVGPIVEIGKSKDDRAVESALSDIDSDMRTYVRNNNELPASLNVLLESDDLRSIKNPSLIKELVERDLITYTANNKESEVDYSSSRSSSSTTLFYELCGVYTYRAPSSSSSVYSNYREAKLGKNCQTLDAFYSNVY